MAFNGLLFKFGSYNFPNEYIQFDTYDIAPNQRQDLDSYTDGNGVTHRNALAHTKTQIQFTTVKLNETAARPVIDGIVSNYLNYSERDASCTYFDPESGVYKTGHFYLDPSVQFRIRGIEDGIPHYGEISFSFIEY